MSLIRRPGRFRRAWGPPADSLLVAAATASLTATAYSVLRYREACRAARGHREVDRAFAETTEQYRALFDFHPDGVYSLDLEGRFTRVNEAAERLSGYTADELLSMNFLELIPADHAETVLGAFEDVVERRTRNIEAAIQHKDGHLVHLSLTGLPIVVGDEIVGVYGIAEDITERIRMQREVEEARLLAEEASRAKSLFLATMSHELRTPLTSVIASAEMLGETELDGTQHRLTEVLHRSGVRLLRLVDELLDFSRVEAGHAELYEVAFSPAEVLAEVLAPVRQVAEARGLTLEAAYDDLPEVAVGDPVRVAQVLTNLLDNAVKFTDEGGVRLSAFAKAQEGRTDLHLEVADTGIGLASEHHGLVFEPFSQGDSSITRRYGGTGLGLAIVRQLVELMQGELDIESTPGRGTTVSLRLPLGLPG